MSPLENKILKFVDLKKPEEGYGLFKKKKRRTTIKVTERTWSLRSKK